MKRFCAPAVFALVAWILLLAPLASADAPAMADPVDLQSVEIDCDLPAVDPELAALGLTPEPSLMAPACGPCSMGECRGKYVGASCALHAEEPVPGTCNVVSPNQCFDGSAICGCG